MRKFAYGRVCCVAFVVLLFSSATLAQDPTKVEPTHYKLAFENEYVQVVNVHYGPHEKSSMHAHPGGVVVVLTAGHLPLPMKMARHKRCLQTGARRGGSRRSSTEWKISGRLRTAPSISELRTSV